MLELFPFDFLCSPHKTIIVYLACSKLFIELVAELYNLFKQLFGGPANPELVASF